MPGHWGHHQLDGLGTWLWSLDRHLSFSDALQENHEILQATDLISHYLQTLWQLPCSDCWEENETGIHTYTLAATYAGLIAHSNIRRDAKSYQTAQEIKDFLLNKMNPERLLHKKPE